MVDCWYWPLPFVSIDLKQNLRFMAARRCGQFSILKNLVSV
jgi:hypothetical protein